jgi:hypothetical protein
MSDGMFEVTKDPLDSLPMKFGWTMHKLAHKINHKRQIRACKR